MTHGIRPHADGGAWLFDDAETAMFTPERLTDEHRMISRTTEAFVDAELLPRLEQLEAKDWELARRLLRRAGDLGLLGLGVSEEFGGLDLDKVSSLVVSEAMARSASFATTFGSQANLCALPIAMFGTPDQKRRYLPGLVSGALVGAYALSEAGSGSDALAARTRASRIPDGAWILSGEKMWTSNGGFADLFIVFAKVDGLHFTAFLVERAFAGVTAGKEEHKMGLHGASTTPVVLQDVRVPSDNVLGEIGKGHKVALNTLNYGRFSLGAMCTGGCKAAIGTASRYARERRQFGRPIAAFGAIRHKLGAMVARTYAAESVMYRTAGLIDAAMQPDGGGLEAARAFEAYAIESSIAKVLGSETLDDVLDESVQIHGGNGFVREYGVERAFRDARVNRIFEGTNEINRLAITGLLVRRGLKGELPLVAAATRLQDEILSPTLNVFDSTDAPLEAERRLVASFKKVALMVIGTAMQTYGDRLADEQEVLAWAADLLIDTYAADSAARRARQARAAGHARAGMYESAARVFVTDAAFRVDVAAKNALAAMAEGDTLRTLLAALRRVLKTAPINTVALRRQLADVVVADGRYVLG